MGKGYLLLGWHRKAISAYTWCISEKGKWLHKIKKGDTVECDCRQEQTGKHLAEGCELLAEARKLVEKEEIREWGTRHSRNQKEKKAPVGPEKEKEEEKEGDKLGSFFYKLYDFLNPVSSNAPVFVPAELPPRFAINFVPAMPPVVPMSFSAPPVIASSSDYSVVSSANFILPTCIEPTP